MLTTLLTALVFILLLVVAWQFIRSRAIIEAGTIPWRVAMDFVAEEGCDMPHEFAACFVAGNHAAIDEKFPNFEGFARQRRAEWSVE
jgi:hypothetical protein